MSDPIKDMRRDAARVALRAISGMEAELSEMRHAIENGYRSSLGDGTRTERLWKAVGAYDALTDSIIATRCRGDR